MQQTLSLHRSAVEAMQAVQGRCRGGARAEMLFGES